MKSCFLWLGIIAGCAMQSARPAALPVSSYDQTVRTRSGGRDFALTIGNDHYQTEWSQLATASNDANAVADVLHDDYGFEVTRLVDATRSEVVTAFDELRSRVTEEDRVLVYYAGHGHKDDASSESYWIPVDARARGRANWISSADIKSFMMGLRAAHVLVVADACFAAAMLRGSQFMPGDYSMNFITALSNLRSRQLWTSGGDEPVPDAGSDAHSYFATRFIAALRENSRIVTGGHLADIVRQKLSYDLNQVPQFGPVQGVGHNGGEFFFVRTSVPDGVATRSAQAQPAARRTPTQSVEIVAGPMPNAVDFSGLYFSPQYGEMNLNQNGPAVIGEYKHEMRTGTIQGEAEGDVLKFEWIEHKAMVSNRAQETRGHGYFRYVVDQSNGDHLLKGEWGLGDTMMGGGPWNAYKAKGRQPRVTAESEGTSHAETTDGLSPRAPLDLEEPAAFDSATMSTAVDRRDLQRMLNENMEKMRTSAVVQRWMGEKRPAVSVLPMKNDTSAQIDSPLQALISDVETKLIEWCPVRVISLENQQDLLTEIRRQYAQGFDQSDIARWGKKTGARYFVTGKVYTTNGRVGAQRRVQYYMFMQVIDVETGEILFQNKSAVTKAIVRD